MGGGLIMSKYKFNSKSNYWEADENENLNCFLYTAEKGEWGKAVKQFFSIPQIKEWVENNDWNSVFREWDDQYSAAQEPGLNIGEEKEYRKWIADVLGLFLSLSGIEFMSYLDDTYVEKNFYKQNYYIEEE